MEFLAEHDPLEKRLGAGDNGAVIPLHQLSADLVKNSLHMLKVYLGIEHEQGMNFKWVSQSSKKAITIYSSPIAGSSMHAIKAKTMLKGVSVSDLIKLLTDDSRMGEYDDSFDGTDGFTRINDNTVMRRIFYKSSWPVAPRDFCVHSTWEQIADPADPSKEAIFYVSKSPPFAHSIHSTVQGYVRGNIIVSGYYLRPIEGEGCEVSVAFHVEMNGTLPVSMVNLVTASAPFKLFSGFQNLAKS